MLKRVEQEIVAPIDLDPNCPSILSELVKRCCELNPDDRFQSAEEIVSFLYQNDKSSKAHVLEVSSAHHSIISVNDDDKEWSSSLWKGIDDKKGQRNIKKVLLISFLCFFFISLLYFVFVRFF